MLEEKGWIDPFHEGPPAVASRVPDAEADGDAPAEAFAPEPEEAEQKAGEVGGRGAGGEAANESGADRETVLKDEEARPSAVGEARERGADGPVHTDSQAAIPRRAEALAQAEEAPAEDPAVAAVGEVSAADELAAAAEERQDPRAKSVQPVPDPWHALPGTRLSAPVGAAGCYRLEYSWSPGVANLPGALELATSEPEGRSGQSVFAVLGRGGLASDLHEAIWSSPHPDSIWVQLVSDGDGDVVTVRAGRSGSDWEGEARVFRPGGPVSVGQTRGAVRLVGIGCEPR